MIRKPFKIVFAFLALIVLISCKNTKQKLQEYVVAYNKEAVKFKADDVTLTTARGYINDSKIELRFETDLEQNETNKKKAEAVFPLLLKEMLKKNQIPKELIDEGVLFHVYFLADDNTVFVKEVINKEEINKFLK
jgi:polyisoprenoid-binding protein YceI